MASTLEILPVKSIADPSRIRELVNTHRLAVHTKPRTEGCETGELKYFCVEIRRINLTGRQRKLGSPSHVYRRNDTDADIPAT